MENLTTFPALDPIGPREMVERVGCLFFKWHGSTHFFMDDGGEDMLYYILFSETLGP